MIDRIAVPDRDLVTSFSSKSELALNLSTNGQDITFMGYKAPVGAVDVSNSNTPAVVDPTNPVPGTDYRAVADLGRDGFFHSFTLTNAYSGNNGRAAVLNNAGERDLHRRQRRQRRQPAAGRRDRRRRRADPVALVRARVVPDAGRADPGRRASASPSWATRRTRSARTRTSAA